MKIKIKIAGADVIQDSVLIHFSDGTSVLFDPGFLYRHRDDNGNSRIAEEEAG